MVDQDIRCRCINWRVGYCCRDHCPALTSGGHTFSNGKCVHCGAMAIPASGRVPAYEYLTSDQAAVLQSIIDRYDEVASKGGWKLPIVTGCGPITIGEIQQRGFAGAADPADHVKVPTKAEQIAAVAAAHEVTDTVAAFMLEREIRRGGVTEWQDELLDVLDEECKEVGMERSKGARFGMDSRKPKKYATTVRHALAAEIGDLLGVVDMLIVEGVIDPAIIAKYRAAKPAKVRLFSRAHRPDLA